MRPGRSFRRSSGAGYPGDQLYFVDGNLADYSADFAPGLIAGAKGTLPGLYVGEGDFRERLLEVDPSLADFSYVRRVVRRGDTASRLRHTRRTAPKAPTSASTSARSRAEPATARRSTSFADAAALLAEGEQVDYDGQSGPITLDENGDPTEATVGIYEYGDDNTYTLIE